MMNSYVLLSLLALTALETYAQESIMLLKSQIESCICFYKRKKVIQTVDVGMKKVFKRFCFVEWSALSNEFIKAVDLYFCIGFNVFNYRINEL